MLLGEILLNEICDLIGDAANVLVRDILEQIKKEVNDLDSALYALVLTYGAHHVVEDEKIKIKRKIACLDLANFVQEYDDSWVYIKKPENVEEALIAAIKAITYTLRKFLGDAAMVMIKHIARKLAMSFKSPEELAVWVTSELSRNPYSPKVSIEIAGSKINVYMKYPIEIDESVLEGTVVPFAIAYAAAFMRGNKELKLNDMRLLDKNTVLISFETYQ